MLNRESPAMASYSTQSKCITASWPNVFFCILPNHDLLHCRMCSIHLQKLEEMLGVPSNCPYGVCYSGLFSVVSIIVLLLLDLGFVLCICPTVFSTIGSLATESFEWDGCSLQLTLLSPQKCVVFVVLVFFVMVVFAVVLFGWSSFPWSLSLLLWGSPSSDKKSFFHTIQNPKDGTKKWKFNEVKTKNQKLRKWKKLKSQKFCN